MIVSEFYKRLIRSGVFYFYVNVVFFASIIFFSLNDNLFTPLEAIIGITFFTVLAKAISNIMCAWGVSFINLGYDKQKMENQLKQKQAQTAVIDLKYKNKSQQDKDDNKKDTQDAQNRAA